MRTADQIFDQLITDERHIDPVTLESVITLAVEIAREGREGRKIGTLFTIGDESAVLERSRCLILDPLEGHPPESRRIDESNARETIKELAQLDGGFVVSDDGFVLSAARYFDASREQIDIPLGLGSRHMAAASISRCTSAVAVVVSESAVVRVFDNGDLVGEIIPELYMLRHHRPYLEGPGSVRRDGNELTVLSKT